MRRGISVTFGILALVAGALTVAAGASSAPWLPSGRIVLSNSSQPRRPSTARKATAQGYGGRQVITPAAIAVGDGDGYLLTLSQLIASHGQPVYIRLFPEMN